MSLHASNAPLALVGTHCEGIQEHTLPEISEEITSHCFHQYKVRLITHVSANLSFCSIDNSLGKKNAAYLALLKGNIQAVLDGRHKFVKLSSLDMKIKVAWVYLLDVLL